MLPFLYVAADYIHWLLTFLYIRITRKSKISDSVDMDHDPGICIANMVTGLLRLVQGPHFYSGGKRQKSPDSLDSLWEELLCIRKKYLFWGRGIRLQDECLIKCLLIQESTVYQKPFCFAELWHKLGYACLWRKTGANFNLPALKREEGLKDLRAKWKGKEPGRLSYREGRRSKSKSLIVF